MHSRQAPSLPTDSYDHTSHTSPLYRHLQYANVSLGQAKRLLRQEDDEQKYLHTHLETLQQPVEMERVGVPRKRRPYHPMQSAAGVLHRQHQHLATAGHKRVAADYLAAQMFRLHRLMKTE